MQEAVVMSNLFLVSQVINETKFIECGAREGDPVIDGPGCVIKFAISASVADSHRLSNQCGYTRCGTHCGGIE